MSDILAPKPRDQVALDWLVTTSLLAFIPMSFWLPESGPTQGSLIFSVACFMTLLAWHSKSITWLSLLRDVAIAYIQTRATSEKSATTQSFPTPAPANDSAAIPPIRQALTPAE
jgi:hypothetical protein